MKKHLKIELKPVGNTCLFYRVLEQEGLPEYKPNGYIKISDSPNLNNGFFLRGTDNIKDNKECIRQFASKENRDKFILNIIQAINKELFREIDKPKAGDIVLVKNEACEEWEARKLIVVLPVVYDKNFICESDKDKDSDEYTGWRYMKPLKEAPFTQDDDIYEWTQE